LTPGGRHEETWSVRRVAPLALVLLLGLPSVACATGLLADPGARVFTIAGGGSRDVREGLLATRASLPYAPEAPAAVLPDGRIAIPDSDPTLFQGGSPFVVGLDGRIHMLPPIVDRSRWDAAMVAGQPDGSLVAVRYDEQVLYRLAAGRAAWERWFAMRSVPGWDRRHDEVYAIGGLPDGVVLATTRGVLRLVDGQAMALPIDYADELALMPDGGLALFDSLEPGTAWIGALTGPFTPITLHRPRERDLEYGFAALADGTLIRADVVLQQLDRTGTLVGEAGLRPGLGPGDGGRPVTAAVNYPNGVAGLGSALVLDEDSFGGARSALDRGAERGPRGGLIVDDGDSRELRVVVPPGPVERTYAAITASTFASIRSGRVDIVSTSAGTALLTVRHGRDVVARVGAPVQAGAATLSLPHALPRGNFHLTLAVHAADGTVALGRLALTTRRRLTMRRARRMAGQVEIGARVRCGRLNATRVDCKLAEPPLPDGSERRCGARVTVILRPDGARAFESGGPRKCRAVPA
jgi:hypothetical protein